ncbi:YHYH domain-containing protein [Curvibacter sp. CHRR-16]|nr:YHYH domain-containing protein [Curvibacter sp. CHRR-16]MBT0571256.1 YHYH domain-containing protein [Curvibacter sp. CHRR-16]
MKKIVLFALLLVSSLVFAHSGGTDKDGCHNDRKAGTRHCH